MYTGSYAVTMDAKGRLPIPVRFREQLQAEHLSRLVVTAHNEDACLLIYTETQWQILAPKIQSLPNATSKSVRRLQRVMIGNASTQEMDGNGRIMVPPTLRELAVLGKDLVVAGVGHRFEIWNESDWNALKNGGDDDDELPEAVQLLNI